MSDTDTTIRPALTPEQWEAKKDVADWMGPMVAFDGGTAGLRVVGPSERRGIAALALYGQPFGFTHEDVALMNFLGKQPKGFDIEWGEDMRARARSIADRIASLLPPETP